MIGNCPRDCDCADVTDCLFAQHDAKWPSVAGSWLRVSAVVLAAWIVVAVVALVVIGVCASSCDKVCDPKSSQACFR